MPPTADRLGPVQSVGGISELCNTTELLENLTETMVVNPPEVDPVYLLSLERQRAEKAARSDAKVHIQASATYEPDWERSFLERNDFVAFPFGEGIRSSSESLAELGAHYIRTGLS